MSENSPYFESITAARSMLVEDPFESENETISLETQSDLAKDSIGASLRDNFGQFLPLLRQLNVEDYEMFLSYYFLKKPQWCLAKLYQSTQTLCSFRIRMALKKLGIVTLYQGQPSTEVLDTILESHGLNHILPDVATSALVDDYRRLRSFSSVALHRGLHRPDVRRALTKASSTLMADAHEEHMAIGAYIHGMIDKASITGSGYSARKVAKHAHLHKSDPGCVGSFDIDVMDPSFEEHVLVSRASNC